MKQPAFVLAANTDPGFTIQAAYQHLCRINTIAYLLLDELEEQLSINADTPEWVKLHSTLALSMLVKQLSGELLEHLEIVD